MAKVLLDASALLAWLNEEKGADKVDKVLGEACIGAVSFSEAGARLLDAGVPEEHLADALDIGLEVIPFDTPLALAAAQLRGITKPYGLGLGDRACLALGWTLKLPILTADTGWRKVKVAGIRLRFIR
jgi:PIN domain nuclease of toxin-antitoxin system